MINYVIKLKGFEEQIARFRALPKVIEKAQVSALNKIGAKAVTAAKRGITDVYNIKSGAVAKIIDRIPAKASYTGKQGRLWTTIKAKDERTHLFMFGGLPTSPPSQKGIAFYRRKWPSVKILKERPRRPVYRDKETLYGPFVARMPSGHVGIFTRTTEWREGGQYWRGKRIDKKYQIIKELPGVRLGKMFSTAGKKAIVKLNEEKGSQILQHELEYYFEKELKK